MKQAILFAFTAIVISGCSSETDPNERNFGAAIDAYLIKEGTLCLNTLTWPMEFSDRGQASPFDGIYSASADEKKSLAALISQGIVTASENDKPILSAGEPTGRTRHITRYELTKKGKQFFHESPTSFRLKDGEMHGKLCYGNERLDKVVKWEGPIKLGDYQEARVQYLYKIDNLADWAQSEEVQASFSKIKKWVAGVGNRPNTHDVHLTNIGWEAN